MAKVVELTDDELAYLEGLVSNRLRTFSNEYEDMLTAARQGRMDDKKSHAKLIESQHKLVSLLESIISKLRA